MTSDIIFIPTSSGGYYVDRSQATIVSTGGYGRLEFDLSDEEIEELEREEWDVWGNEADLIFPGVQEDWVSYIKNLPSVRARFEDCHSREIFEYWCRVNENNEVIDSW